MNLMHEKVQHRVFHTGMVVSQTENNIEVEFGPEYGVKKFMYPNAFENFLMLEKSASQLEINAEIARMHDRLEALRKQHEEQELQREEERQALLKQQKTAVRKKRTTVKSAAKATAAS